MPTSGRNVILSRLSPADLELLLPHLEPVELPVRRPLEKRGQRARTVYFIDSGIASVVAKASNDRNAEVCIVGREGMTRVDLILGVDAPADCEIFMQLGGFGRCMETVVLTAAMEQSRTLHMAMLRFAHDFMLQMTATALANGCGKIQERLARWLLMCDDRADGDLLMTHEFLAVMLGVRRSGVTTALKQLERRGSIGIGRGIIRIVDREALTRCSNGFYTRSPS